MMHTLQLKIQCGTFSLIYRRKQKYQRARTYFKYNIQIINKPVSRKQGTTLFLSEQCFGRICTKYTSQVLTISRPNFYKSVYNKGYRKKKLISIVIDSFPRRLTYI